MLCKITLHYPLLCYQYSFTSLDKNLINVCKYHVNSLMEREGTFNRTIIFSLFHISMSKMIW